MSTPLLVLALSLPVVNVWRPVLVYMEEIVALLADDSWGSARERVTGSADLAPYRRAFAGIDADPAQLLLVVNRRPLGRGDHATDFHPLAAGRRSFVTPGRPLRPELPVETPRNSRGLLHRPLSPPGRQRPVDRGLATSDRITRPPTVG